MMLADFKKKKAKQNNQVIHIESSENSLVAYAPDR